MPIVLEKLRQDSEGVSPRYAWVDSIAERLRAHLDEPLSRRLIAEANRPGQSSAHVQLVFLQFASELGFKNESKGLFAGYANPGLRPDYYLPVPPDSGVLLEVERGKTTINNMDLLDFWKCHLCKHAHYLFLMVPIELRQNDTMSARREFDSVRKRLSAFFEPRNYTNVKAVFLFGY